MRFTDPTFLRHGTTLFAPARSAERRRAVDDVRPARRTRSAVAAFVAAAAVFAGACSTPGEPAESGDDPVQGTADIDVDNVDVEDGTEGGLDLDNGNVPGSENDQDLDPFDAENDLNTGD